MDTINASCPQCGTQYELTPDQLAVANGQVRCGACMTVFQAGAPQPAAPSHQPRKADRSSFVKDVSDDDQLTTSSKPKPDEIDDDLLFADGDSDILINDSESERISSHRDDDFSQDFMDSDDHDSFSNSDLVESINSKSSHADEDWAAQLLEEEGEQLNDEDEFQNTRKPASNKPKVALGKHDQELDDELEGVEDLLALQPASDLDDLEIPDLSEKAGLLGRISAEPLEFQLHNASPLLRNLIFGSASLILLAVFVSQLFYFQFDELARTNKWRPFYAFACKQLDCQLPSQFELKEISAKHLTVKSHPYYQDALLVDAVITNHAAIAQPFPNIDMYFYNDTQQVVVARRFTPADYLRGELASTQMMPSRHPIHLALEIDDPKTTRGYEIKLSY